VCGFVFCVTYYGTLRCGGCTGVCVYGTGVCVYVTGVCVYVNMLTCVDMRMHVCKQKRARMCTCVFT